MSNDIYFSADVPGIGTCEIREDTEEAAMDALRELFSDRRDWNEEEIQITEMTDE
jgi:tRNA A37 methylthiotransferase MiaB